jgi:fibronectin type 3 domain-containing protein
VIQAYQYTDDNAGAGIANHYTVTAVDEAQLESDPAVPVSGVKIENSLKAPIQWKQPVMLADQKQVVLSWGYDLPGVTMFRIYRSDGENPAVMYKSVTGDKRNFTDRLAFDKEYKYQVLAIFENGAKSRLSEALLVKF